MRKIRVAVVALIVGVALTSAAQPARPPDWPALVGKALCSQGATSDLYQVPILQVSVLQRLGYVGLVKLATVKCAGLRILGAKAGIDDAGDGRIVRWVFVSVTRNPSVRGWVPLRRDVIQRAKIDWKKAPLVPEDVLYRTGDWRKDVAQAICFQNVSFDGRDLGAEIFQAPSLTGGPPGYQLVQKGLLCGTLEASGVSSAPDFLYGGTSEPVKWVLVGLKSNPSIRGFAVLRMNAPVRRPVVSVDWTQVSVVPPEVLIPSSGLPDLAFGGMTPDKKPGDPCYSPGIFTAGWNVTLVNRGTGLGPSSFVVSWRDQAKTLQFRRGFLPEESHIVNYPGEASLVLDSNGAVAESDEANNSIDLPRGATLICR
jgi:hypothetical protein